MPSTIKVFDGTVVHTLEVSQEDAAKANQDSLFASQLMHNYEAIIVHSPDQPVAEETESSGNNSLSHTTVQEFSQDFSQDSSPEKDGFRWPHEAILLLLTVYKDQEHQIISGTMTMKKFWSIIASQLIKKGYNVNASQCKSKMAGLKNTYKSVKDHKGRSKYNKYRTWRYYDIMDEIFKRRPWVTKVLTSDSPTSSAEYNVDNKKRNQSPCKTELPPKRLKQFDMLENIIAVTEENTSIRRKMHEEAMVRQDKLLDILGKIPSNNSNSSSVENNANNERSRSFKTELSSRYVKQYALLERIITVMEESTTERKRMHEEAMARQDKLLDILEKILNK
ncbi:uncharacterized protein LOC115243966 [Formica exsecta]|uniref:uncharacterized protein LOC115243966 n=1 Tax=Formica exsecta TaxID=72781 RepID=UPI0011451AE7|nr:uncharacterized protein LOC115243966 [Formica exsecta]XP_029677159.1 uncharacterized protein LOC115243966 [Formica exsecta]